MNPIPERLPFPEADARLDGRLSNGFLGCYEDVLLFDGDLTLDGDFVEAVAEITSDGSLPDLIAVTGDLTVKGRIQLYDGTPGLSVDGTTRAQTLEGGDCEIDIGAGTFTYLIYGRHSHGILLAGPAETPWVINTYHEMHVKADGAYRIDNSDNDDGVDFNTENIPDSFVSEVVDPETGEIVVDGFLDRLRAGLPVLRQGAVTLNGTPANPHG